MKVVDAEYSGEAHAYYGDYVQHEIELFYRRIKAEDEDRQRKDYLHYRHGKIKFYPAPDEVIVVNKGVGRGDEEIEDEHEKVTMIVVPDAAAGEDAVVVALQDASVAGRTVPGARRRQSFAGRAQPPAVLSLRCLGGHHRPPRARVAQHGVREIPDDVHHQEVAEDEVTNVGQAASLVQLRQNHPQLEPVDERHDRQHERHRRQVAQRPGQNFFSDYHRSRSLR